MSTVNWADVVEEAKAGGGSFEPLPDGDYNFKVTAATAGFTQNQKPMYTLELTVQDGPSANRKVWDRLIVSADNGRAMGFFFRKTKAFGLGMEWFQQYQPTDEQVVANLLNKVVRAKVGQSNYQGKAGNEIKEYYVIQNSGPTFQPTPGAAPVAPPAAPVAPPAPAPVAAPPAPPAPAAAPAYAPAPVAAPPVQAYAPAPAAAPPAAPAPASPWEAAGGQVPPPSPF